MSELWTTRQVQERLKVDRITVYRMLQDGRLQGVKIGQQWRFERAGVERLLNTRPAASEAPAAEAAAFPTHCLQTIQDLFADVSGLGALVLDTSGMPLTTFSSPCALLALLLENPAGLAAMRAAWGSFTAAPGSRFFTCPAGLQYTAAPIRSNGELVALFLTGGFYWSPPDPREQAERLRRVSQEYGLPLDALHEAAATVPVIDPAMHQRVETWPQSAARAIQSILQERGSFIQRMQQIASLTQIP